MNNTQLNYFNILKTETKIFIFEYNNHNKKRNDN